MPRKQNKKTKRKARDTREFLIAKMTKIGTYNSVVRAKCVECIYDVGVPGTWRKQVEECTSFACPLYNKRPIQGKR